MLVLERPFINYKKKVVANAHYLVRKQVGSSVVQFKRWPTGQLFSRVNAARSPGHAQMIAAARRTGKIFQEVMRDVWKIQATGNDLQLAIIPLARTRFMARTCCISCLWTLVYGGSMLLWIA